MPENDEPPTMGNVEPLHEEILRLTALIDRAHKEIQAIRAIVREALENLNDS